MRILKEIPPEQLSKETFILGKTTREEMLIAGIAMCHGIVEFHPEEMSTKVIQRGAAALAMHAAGMRRPEISNISGIPEDTTRNHLRALAEEWGLNGLRTPQLVSQAFKHGLFSVTKQIETPEEGYDPYVPACLKLLALGEHTNGAANSKLGNEHHPQIRRPHNTYRLHLATPLGLRNPASAVMFGHLAGILQPEVTSEGR